MAPKNPVRAQWLDILKPCPYLPEQTALMEYAIVDRMTTEQYADWINDRWRKMGHVLFRPQCQSCRACQPIRVLAAHFQPRRIHKRIIQANAHLQMEFRKAEVTQEQVDLVDRYELSREETVGWPPSRSSKDESLRALAGSPLQVFQLCLYEQERLVAFCIVDVLPDGFSAVNSFWDPALMKKSLGVYVILCLISEAKRLNLPHIYLGYYVAGCRSMEYKARFYPSEILTERGWEPFRS